MQQRHDVRFPAAMRLSGPVRVCAILVVAALSPILYTAGLATAAEGITPAPQAPSATPQAPPPASGSGSGGTLNSEGAPQLREDEPAAGETEGEQEARPPFRGGCPYRGRSLELIV